MNNSALPFEMKVEIVRLDQLNQALVDYAVRGFVPSGGLDKPALTPHPDQEGMFYLSFLRVKPRE
jgi:hypothetical protein